MIDKHNLRSVGYSNAGFVFSKGLIPGFSGLRQWFTLTHGNLCHTPNLQIDLRDQDPDGDK